MNGDIGIALCCILPRILNPVLAKELVYTAITGAKHWLSMIESRPKVFDEAVSGKAEWVGQWIVISAVTVADREGGFFSSGTYKTAVFLLRSAKTTVLVCLSAWLIFAQLCYLHGSLL